MSLRYRILIVRNMVSLLQKVLVFIDRFIDFLLEQIQKGE